MSYAPVGNFYSGRIARRAQTGVTRDSSFVAASIPASRPAIPDLLDHGRTYIKIGEGRGLAIALQINDFAARAFVSNGWERAQFFYGQPGSSLLLDSVDGSRIVASPRSESQECWLTRPGTSAAVLHFKAKEAASGSGLFRVSIEGGRVNGADGCGNRLEANLVQTLADGTVHVGGSVTLATGGDMPLEAFLTPDSEGVQWWIVDHGGRVVGGSSDDRGAGSAFWVHDA